MSGGGGVKGLLKPKAGLPFSRPLQVDAVPEVGLDLEIEATQAECAAIAAEAGLPAVARLAAAYHVARRGGTRFHVHGALAARITQTCVVSLEPFESDISQPVDVTFARSEATTTPAFEPRSRRHVAETEAPKAVPAVVQVDDDDPPDPIVDGMIDLGALAFEFLMLARDVHPRRPGVAFDDVTFGQGGDASPFDALRRLKDEP